ncbi:hypothetical protein TI39_contig345g00070 [Zymoseptoria brevis]|uniref:F-box domain-containing protein n=1 Tax=Zymoseptoria brevis TaxID=1047168 RepID=A0A0F4GRY3_9PEZI|nr:hypothetical protein TI39_contig345g00070 [Zymoseptoria brevis]
MAADQTDETAAVPIADDNGNSPEDITSSSTTRSSALLVSESPHHRVEGINPNTSFDQPSMATALDISDSDEQAASFTLSGGTTKHLSPESSTERSAGHRLVGTFELLQSILVHLGIISLLRARRASTRFRDVVDKSSRVQSRMGLRQARDSYVQLPLLEISSGSKDEASLLIKTPWKTTACYQWRIQ